jgi:hypothetical protein
MYTSCKPHGKSKRDHYILVRCNSLIIVKITDWRLWFFPHKGFLCKNLVSCSILFSHYLLTSGIESLVQDSIKKTRVPVPCSRCRSCIVLFAAAIPASPDSSFCSTHQHAWGDRGGVWLLQLPFLGRVPWAVHTTRPRVGVVTRVGRFIASRIYYCCCFTAGVPLGEINSMLLLRIKVK